MGCSSGVQSRWTSRRCAAAGKAAVSAASKPKESEKEANAKELEGKEEKTKIMWQSESVAIPFVPDLD